MRLLIIFLLASFGAFGQTVQNNNTPTRFNRMLKSDSILIIPVGCDTPLTSNPKWGTATDGALFLKTCDTTLWVKMGQRFVQINGTASITGGDTTIFQVTLDSTGQPNNRLLFARNNFISSSPKILIDSANSRLIINNSNVSTGGAGMQLYVVGNATIAGLHRVGGLDIYNATQVTDTTTYKPLAIDAAGSVRKLDRWPGSGGTTLDTTSLSNRINLKADKAINLTAGDGLVGGGDLSANRSFRVDTSQVANKIWVTDRIALKVNISDTASMLSPYLRKADTLQYNSALNERLRIADTSTMLSAYIRFANYPLLKTSQTVIADTGRAVNALATGGALTKVADSLGALISGAGGGTVTSVATNNGTGITGGTITNSGTLAIDTLVISTRAWRDKLADSLGAIIVTKGTGTVTSVGLTMPSAFSVANSPVTGAATLAVTGAGTTSQYIRGDGSLATYTTGLAIDSVGIRRYGTTTANNLASWDAGAKTVAASGIASTGNTSAIKDSVNFTIGFQSGLDLTTGWGNYYIGKYTGRKSTTAYANIGIGKNVVGANSGAAFTGYGNIGIGNQQGSGNNGPLGVLTSGYFNTVVGSNDVNAFTAAAGASITTGRSNSYYGASAGASNSTGDYNTAIGAQALQVSTNYYSTAIGAQAAYRMTTASGTFIGFRAGEQVTTGDANFGLGSGAMSNPTGNALSLTGNNNMIIGNQSMAYYGATNVTISNNRNTIVGNGALLVGTTAVNDNTMIGYVTGGGVVGLAGIVTGSRNIAIGSIAVLPSLSGSDQIVIGSTTDGANPYRALLSDISGSTRRWLFNATTTDVTAIANASAGLEINGTSLGFLQPRLTNTQMNAISTPATGLSVYNTDSLRTAEYNGTTWKQTVYTDDIDIERRKSRYEYFNDFVIPLSATGNSGNDLIFSGTGTGSAIAAQTLSAGNQYGLITVTTGTTTTGRASAQTSATSFRLGNGTWVYETEVSIPTLSTVTERFSFITGFWDATTANQTDAVAFVYDEGGVSTGSTAAAYWQVVTASNSTRTWNTSLTQITVTAGQYYTLRIEINAAGTSAAFFIDGTLVSTQTTNIPTAAGREVGYGSQILKSAGTTARPFYTDYILAKSTLTTPR